MSAPSSSRAAFVDTASTDRTDWSIVAARRALVGALVGVPVTDTQRRYLEWVLSCDQPTLHAIASVIVDARAGVVSVDLNGATPDGDHVAVPIAAFADLSYLIGWAQGTGAPAAVLARVQPLLISELPVIRFEDGRS